ncbi:MAG: hypothetical protein ACOC22_03700 [bacterium]
MEKKIQCFDAEFVRTHLVEQARKKYEKNIVHNQLSNVFEKIQNDINESYSVGAYIKFIYYNKELSKKTINTLKERGFVVETFLHETPTKDLLKYKIYW